MIGRPARHDDDLGNILEILLCKAVDIELHRPVARECVERILDDARLLADLLHHEVLIAALFGALCIPIDMDLAFVDDVAVEVIECGFPRLQARHLQIVDIVDVARMLEHGRHIGGKIGVLVRDTDDHRAVLAGDINLIGIVRKEDGKGISSPHAHHRLGERVDGPHFIFFIVVIYELDEHFRVRLGIKGIAVMQELFLDLAVVFDDAVVDTHDAAVVAAMGVGVGLRRVAVRRPARVADAAAAADRDRLQLLLEVLELALGFDDLRGRTVTADGDARRVIPSVFELFQAADENGRRLSFADISDDPAHILSPLSFRPLRSPWHG